MHRYKIVIAGNHDFAFQNSRQMAKSMLTDCIYLEDSETTIEGIKPMPSPLGRILYNHLRIYEDISGAVRHRGS